MAQQTVNPYPFLGTQFTNGLTNIITTLPGSPTVDDLVNAVAGYIKGVYYGVYTPFQEQEITSIAYWAIDSYLDSLIKKPNTSLYNSSQKRFINFMIGQTLVNETSVDTINNLILNIEDNITKVDMKVADQAYLLFSTMIGLNAYNYWLNQISLGVGSAWGPYLTPAKVSAMGNVPFWTAAAIEGTLIGAKSTNKGQIDPTTEMVGNEFIAALTAALTIAAGKVIFLWIPNVEFPINNNNSYGKVNFPTNINFISEDTYISRVKGENGNSDFTSKITIYKTDDGGVYYTHIYDLANDEDSFVTYFPDLEIIQQDSCSMVNLNNNKSYFIIPFNNPYNPESVAGGGGVEICCACGDPDPCNFGGSCYAHVNDDDTVECRSYQNCDVSYCSSAAKIAPNVGENKYLYSNVLVIESKYIKALPISYISRIQDEQYCEKTPSDKICKITINRTLDGGAFYSYSYDIAGENDEVSFFSPGIIPNNINNNSSNIHINLNPLNKYFMISFNNPGNPLECVGGGSVDSDCTCSSESGSCSWSSKDCIPKDMCKGCCVKTSINSNNYSGGILLFQANFLRNNNDKMM